MNSLSRTVLLSGLCGIALNAAAQDAVNSLSMPERIDEDAMLMTAPPPLPLGAGDTMMFLQFEMAGPSDTVPGKPYEADLTVVTHQPLVDGNTITVEHHSRIYRDTQGRTRRDEEVGPANARQQHVFISDPVAGTSYVIDPDKREAHRLPLSPQRGPTLAFAERSLAAADGAARGDTVFDIAVPAPLGGGAPMFEAAIPASAATAYAAGAAIELPFPGEPQSADLGERMIEGLRVSGTRTTIVIAAQAIGNRAPIEIVTEQWYSPELNIIISSEHRDPRVGETRYQLHDIRRVDPDPGLFGVPADYAIIDPSLTAPP